MPFQKSTLQLVLLTALTVLITAHDAHAVYNSQIGRFIQRDPAGSVDGMNHYHYVKNNPVRYIDRTGTKASEPSSGNGEENDKEQPKPCRFSIKCIDIKGVPGSHCYIDFGDGDICSAHNPPGWPKPGPIIPYCGPFETSPDRWIRDNHPTPRDVLGPERTTLISCPKGTDCKAVKDCVRDVMKKIGECEIPYDPLGPNSNTSLYMAYRKCLVANGCKLVGRKKQTTPQPATRRFAPPVGWPPIDEWRLKPLRDCLDEDDSENDPDDGASGCR